MTQAVTLAVPDYEGMMNGRNPGRLYLDASKYGVGAGLFQLPVGKVEDMSGTHYELLGVRPSATRVEIDKALQAKRRQHLPAEQWAATKEAHRVLSDVAARQQYDAARGWHRTRGRLDLVPLALFSKSLGKHQINWTTWEKEMYAAVEALQAFGSMVTGMSIQLYTDALNSTVLNENLRYPEKILRMLLKIARVCNASWQFFPGHRNKVGDCMSRDMEDRDLVREAAETGAQQPKTLSEAFEFVTRYLQGEEELYDDMDGIMGKDESMSATAQARLMEVFEQAVTPRPVRDTAAAFRMSARQQALRVKSIDGAIAAMDQEVVPALFLPSYAEEEDEPHLYEGLMVLGNCVQLRAELAVVPPIMRVRGARHWLSLYTGPPWAKRDKNEARLVALDGLLEFLRALMTLVSTAAIAHGEAALVALMALSQELRTAAFGARVYKTFTAADLEAPCRNPTSTWPRCSGPYGLVASGTSP